MSDVLRLAAAVLFVPVTWVAIIAFLSWYPTYEENQLKKAGEKS
ncbi:MAG: hypothetical protein AAB618_00785 [Patescibacteria group bacterium]